MHENKSDYHIENQRSMMNIIKLRCLSVQLPLKSVSVVDIRGVARRISNSARQQTPASATTTPQTSSGPVPHI